jgi:hypothetical protein
MAAGMSTDPLQDAKQAAREQAGAVWNDTKETARSLLGEQQRAAAGGLGEFATALRKAARDMDGAGNSTVRRLAESAADGLEHFSGTLRARDLNGLLHDVESFARRQPVAFVGAAVAVGFLAARFLKSSNAPDDTGTPF